MHRRDSMMLHMSKNKFAKRSTGLSLKKNKIWQMFCGGSSKTAKNRKTTSEPSVMESNEQSVCQIKNSKNAETTAIKDTAVADVTKAIPIDQKVKVVQNNVFEILSDGSVEIVQRTMYMTGREGLQSANPVWIPTHQQPLHDHQTSDSDGQSSECDSLFSDLDCRSSERDGQLYEHDGQLLELDSHPSECDNLPSEHDNQASECDSTLLECNNQSLERESYTPPQCLPMPLCKKKEHGVKRRTTIKDSINSRTVKDSTIEKSQQIRTEVTKRTKSAVIKDNKLIEMTVIEDSKKTVAVRDSELTKTIAIRTSQQTVMESDDVTASSSRHAEISTNASVPEFDHEVKNKNGLTRTKYSELNAASYENDKPNEVSAVETHATEAMHIEDNERSDVNSIEDGELVDTIESEDSELSSVSASETPMMIPSREEFSLSMIDMRPTDVKATRMSNSSDAEEYYSTSRTARRRRKMTLPSVSDVPFEPMMASSTESEGLQQRQHWPRRRRKHRRYKSRQRYGKRRRVDSNKSISDARDDNVNADPAVASQSENMIDRVSVLISQSVQEERIVVVCADDMPKFKPNCMDHRKRWPNYNTGN